MAAYIGTAGWTVPKQHAARFGVEGSHLERYAARLNCAEINSSFYRSHRLSTYAKWAASTPDDFRFAVKVPRAATHAAKLVNCGGVLQMFLGECTALGNKLGPLLVQLPPSLAFDEGVAADFFTTLRELHSGLVALEPRHATWFTSAAGRLLREFEIARVAADPPKGSDAAAQPGGWNGLRYFRWHGSPRTYYSEYAADALEALAANQATAPNAETFLVFDNTALGHAAANALDLRQRISNL